jgi:signal transduction histidine kinase/DNA-binding response OmpR family regulator
MIQYRTILFWIVFTIAFGCCHAQERAADGNSVIPEPVVTVHTLLVGSQSFDLDSVSHSNTAEYAKFRYNKKDHYTFYYSIVGAKKQSKIKYSYKLQGIDHHWSQWKSQNHTTYASLPHGKYILHIKAKDFTNKEIYSIEYTFGIQPPWFRNGLAYVGYLFIALSMVTSYIRWRIARIRAQNKLLTVLVKKRTEKVQGQNLILQQQKEEILCQSDKLQKQKTELEEMDQFKQKFFINISHELRTHLTLIISPLQNILNGERKSLPSHMITELGLISRNSNNLKILVDDILNLSKLESQKIQLEETPIHIHEFLRKIWSNFEPLAVHLDIEYCLCLDSIPTDAICQLDISKSEKIFNNLLANALKYTNSGGVVTFVGKLEGSQLVIQAEDTGRGISEEDLPHVFERFFQARHEHGSVQGGAGVGLALAKEFTTLLNGTLSVVSRLGEGSVFTCTLPYKPIVAQSKKDKEQAYDQSTYFAPDATTGVSNKRILIVEDHLEMQQFIHRLLKPYYKTSLAHNGKKALIILENEEIDLVITDVMMPEMDGYELLENLRANPIYHKLPVMMLTAISSEQGKLRALNMGVDEYLTKPFYPQELLAQIQNMLTRYEIRKKLAHEMEDVQEVDGTIQSTATRIKEMPNINTHDAELIQKIEGVILRELENEDFKISDLADMAHLSQSQFRRRVKQATGLSPKQFQQEVGLQKARRLLEEGTYSNPTAVAYSIGIRHVTRFSKLYEERFGKKPIDYFDS